MSSHDSGPSDHSALKTFRAGLPLFNTADRLLVLGLGVILVLVGVTALLSPPNGWDPMQYHLPRMIQWSMRHSVQFFPTHYYIQLFAPPLAEWIMLHLYLLWGSDRLVNLVQWFPYAGSVVGVSLIARSLGADRRGQILSAVFCATLPQGVLAASGAKNDWVLAFWLVCSVVFLVEWGKGPNWTNSIVLGASLGAAVLSKGSVYVFLPPIVVACWLLLSAPQRVSFLRRLPVIAGIAILMNLPQWIRNFNLAGSPVGLPTADVAGLMKYPVDRITPAEFVAGILKNSALHCGLPGAKSTAIVTRSFRKLIELLGRNPDDPGDTWPTSSLVTPHYNTIHWEPSQFEVRPYNFNEYYLGNLPQSLLAALVALVALLNWKDEPPSVLILLGGILAAYFLFCGVFKWQISGARLHLPIFALISAPFGVLFNRHFPRFVLPAAVVLILMALPPALFNTSRPLLSRSWLGATQVDRSTVMTESRDKLYFAGEEQLAESYIAAAAFVRKQGCSDIGLDSSQQLFEYPLFALISPTPGGPVIRFTGVDNLTARFATALDRRPPCLVICPGCRDSLPQLSEYAPALPRVNLFGDLAVFSPNAPDSPR